MAPIRENLLKHYELGSTVEGTRSCHYVVPENTSKICAKILSMEEKSTIFHSFDVSLEEAHTKLIDSLKPNDYMHLWRILVAISC